MSASVGQTPRMCADKSQLSNPQALDACTDRTEIIPTELTPCLLWHHASTILVTERMDTSISFPIDYRLPCRCVADQEEEHASAVILIVKLETAQERCSAGTQAYVHGSSVPHSGKQQYVGMLVDEVHEEPREELRSLQMAQSVIAGDDSLQPSPLAV